MWLVILKMLIMLCEMSSMLRLWLVRWCMRLSIWWVWVMFRVVVGLLSSMILEF